MGHLTIASTKSDERVRALEGNASLSALKISGLEVEVSTALSNFFALNPEAQGLFRTAFYDASRSSINTILETAIKIIRQLSGRKSQKRPYLRL